jgi:glucose 1-dehydrogenase
VVAPGATLTPRTRNEGEDYEGTWRRLTPLQRPAWPSDIADAALFLLSSEAAHITGQTLTVDGGWTFAADVS